MSACTRPRLVKCPTCYKTVAWTDEEKFRPFCSQRCKLIDLGEWIAEEKRIASEHCTEIELEHRTESLWQ